MKIGIDASRAFIKERTGIEEYSYQVIKSLVNKLDEHEVILYMRSGQSAVSADCPLPENWKIKVIKWPYFWTQIGLSLEMLLHPVDTLFIPAHVVPIIHAKNTVVTIHGLEYEFCPGAYSFWERLYMRWSIKFSCRFAKKIIAVSENTKKDLMKLYAVPESKIKVVYEGYEDNFEFRISNFESNPNFQNSNLKIDSKFKIQNSKFLLFIGRLEERKNIIGIIEAFEILREKYKIPHKLILAGKPGYGYEKIKFEIRNSKFEIRELGYVNETQKWQLLKEADIFLFPSFYEGFGLPILEAQSAGVPVVASNNSSVLEIGGTGRDLSVQLVDPNNPQAIAEATYKLISDETLKNDIISKGYKNLERFSWEKCGEKIAKVLLG